MSSESEKQGLIDRREAIRRVTTILGGVALVGGSSLLAACEKERAAPAAKAADGRIGDFTRADVAFLDEVAETILPETKTPGAKAAQVGAFMALMVTDTYDAREQRAFRAGMGALDAASQKAHGAAFTAATPPQRLALLQTLDREQKAEADAREAAAERAPKGSKAAKPSEEADAAKADARLPDQRAENAPNPEVGGAAAVTDEAAPPHYVRMMKELALLGYFTSEIGYTKAMRYVETPGRFDPCAPYAKGEPAWAPHA
jgi:hypothetical protein